MTEAAQRIKDLGGTTKVARALGAPVTTVDSWRHNGIPPWREKAIDDAVANGELAATTAERSAA